MSPVDKNHNLACTLGRKHGIAECIPALIIKEPLENDYVFGSVKRPVKTGAEDLILYTKLSKLSAVFKLLHAFTGNLAPRIRPSVERILISVHEDLITIINTGSSDVSDLYCVT